MTRRDKTFDAPSVRTRDTGVPATGILQRMRRCTAAFKRDDRGATAIEFAIVAVPFLTIVLATMEVGIHYFAARTMDSGVDKAARLLRTGQLPPSASIAQFRQALCDETGTGGVMFLFDCNAFKVDVREIARFTPQTTPRKPDGSLDEGALQFTPGGPETINMVRVYYEWPAFLNWAGFDANDDDMSVPEWSGNKRLFAAVAMYQNEPFDP